MKYFVSLLRIVSTHRLALAFCLGLTSSALIASADSVSDVNLCGLVSCGGWNSNNQANGNQIAAAPTTGNTSTGITFGNYNGSFLAICGSSDSCSYVGGATITLSSPIALNSNAVVNTLINNFYGTGNFTEAVVTFTNSNNQTAEFSLVGDQTVRDYNNYIYTNGLQGYNTNSSLGEVSAEEWWNNGAGGQRLDVQTFVLPASWGGTSLDSIQISDPANYDWDVLSAIQVDDRTVSGAAPEPSAIALVALAGAGLLFVRKRITAW